MAKKRKQQTDAALWRSKLAELEALYGQKELAKKLGRDVSNVRRYKTEKAKPSDELIKKINRMYGRNRSRLTEPKTREKIQKKIESTEKRRQAREPQRQREAIKTQEITSWIDANVTDLDDRQMKELLSYVRSQGLDYAVYQKGNPSEAQFVGLDQLSKNNYGKPKGVKSLKMIGLVMVYPYKSENIRLETRMRHETLSYMSKDWNLETALDYARNYFFTDIEQKERGRKYPDEPMQLIGYYY